jgi:hypothetical protein
VTNTTRARPGVHNFTTINIPAGVTVTTNGSGVLDLRATGAVIIGASSTSRAATAARTPTASTTPRARAAGPPGNPPRAERRHLLGELPRGRPAGTGGVGAAGTNGSLTIGGRGGTAAAAAAAAGTVTSAPA